jgi:hypothetical protein
VKPGEVVLGDILRVFHPNWDTGEVTVIDVQGDKAIVHDRKRPGMRFQVGVEYLRPRTSAGDTGNAPAGRRAATPRGARNARGEAGDSRR